MFAGKTLFSLQEGFAVYVQKKYKKKIIEYTRLFVT